MMVGWSPYELQSKLLKGGYIGDYIGEYYRAIKGILRVLTMVHINRHA